MIALAVALAIGLTVGWQWIPVAWIAAYGFLWWCDEI